MLNADRISKQYPGSPPLAILESVSLELSAGESIAVMGPSGSGKSTLLYLLGGLEPPTSGTITLDGVDPYALGERAQAEFRSANVGFVFQDHLLLPQLSALDNVLVPTIVATRGTAEETSRHARDLLVEVGLGERLDHRPAALSGGERQRVAVARALVGRPRVLLCDEPTGNLDRASADGVADLLLALHREKQTILVVVTHSAALAARFDRRFELRDRRLEPVA